MGDSKPIDIADSNFQSLNDQNSLSAYESAESSPSQNNGEQMKTNIDIRLVDEPYLNCIKSEESSEINTYWGLPPASSLLIDEEDKTDALEYSREKLSQSKSFYDANEVTKTTDDKEYQSLPIEKTEPLINEDESKTKKQTELKKELSQSDLFKLNAVEGEEDMVKVDLKEGASEKTSQLPEMSVPKAKSTTMSFIEKIFKSTSSTKTVAEEKTETKESDETTKSTKTSLSTNLTAQAISASSPNPECSPYKFLMNEFKTNDQKSVSSLKLEGTTTTSSSEASKNSQKNGVVVEKIIENLASLTRKDSEEHDPILTSATPSNSSKKTDLKSKGDKNEKKSNKHKTKSPSKSVSSLSQLSKTETATKVDNVPASSREFCMNLNFNLASAAAATAGGPVVVVDNTNKKSPVTKENNKFTSNASTSSIHNDLKMILEESKDDKNVLGKENKKLNKSTDKKPLPQRQKKEKKDTSKQNISNTSFNSSAADTTSNSMTVETGNLSPTSKTNNLNLIKMMMLMVDQNNTKKVNKTTRNKHLEAERVEEPSLIDLAKQNGRYKYSREFLMEIKDQRSKFIDQIQPEIFKAYCYCMNGKYWDPETYFDIVQFPGDYEKIQANRNNNYRSNMYNKSAGSKYTKNSKYTPNSTFNNSLSKMNMGVTPNAIPNHLQDDSPQPLQVPKNSPKFVDNKTTKESSVQSVFESLGLNTDHIDKSKLDADKILLGLIKNDKKTQEDKSANLMDILNKKSVQSPNILENLMTKQQGSAQKHHPLVFTAQELEMSQLSQEKLSKNKLPNEISMTKLEELQMSMESNDSFAYKQLVKNLNTHPLTSTTALNNKLEASLTKLQNKQKLEKEKQMQNANTKPSWQVSNDRTNMLKQLLNLKTDSAQEKRSTKPSKHYKHKSNKSSHMSTSNGSNSASSSLESSPVDSSNKFPSVNPLEKPFENYMAEENRKQIEHVVANALNHVLNKSPSSVKQPMSPTPKSPIENFFDKINTQQKDNHFNSLLNKMSSKQVKAPESNESDILKWFSDSKNRYSLNEIESMQMHHPASALNKLF